MDLEQIKAKIKEHIEQSKAGLSKEDLKFDFKAKWHNLKSKPGINEFLKDTSAIANTFGPDGFLVYGFNDTNNEYTGAKFSDSNLRDSDDLYYVLIKGLGEAFDINHYDIEIDGNPISILHIPPALNKPFVIRNYQTFDREEKIRKEEQQRIFVRKNTGIREATKHDLELMYYDRKNIIPEYRLDINLFHINLSGTDSVEVSCQMTIENTGRRPVSIYQIDLSYKTTEREYYYSLKLIYRTPGDLKDNITVNPNEIVRVSGKGRANHGPRDNYIPELEQEVKVVFKLNNILQGTDNKKSPPLPGSAPQKSDPHRSSTEPMSLPSCCKQPHHQGDQGKPAQDLPDRSVKKNSHIPFLVRRAADILDRNEEICTSSLREANLFLSLILVQSL